MTRRLAGALCAFAACLSCATGDGDGSTSIRIDTGVIAGAQTPDGLRVFRGIPYAAPPVGPLRWRPPQPVAPWGACATRPRSVPCARSRPFWPT